MDGLLLWMIFKMGGRARSITRILHLLTDSRRLVCITVTSFRFHGKSPRVSEHMMVVFRCFVEQSIVFRSRHRFASYYPRSGALNSSRPVSHSMGSFLRVKC